MQIRISMHPNLAQSLLHQHIRTHFILVLYEQPQRMPHLCYEEPSCYYLRTQACDMKAVVPFPISLAYLQGGSLKQPFDSHVLAVVASPVERSLAILVPSLCHEFRALQQSLQSLEIPVGSSSDEGSVPIKIIGVYLTKSHQCLRSLSFPHKNRNHQSSIPLLVPLLKIQLIVIGLYQLQTDFLCSFSEREDEETLLPIQVGR